MSALTVPDPSNSGCATTWDDTQIAACAAEADRASARQGSAADGGGAAATGTDISFAFRSPAEILALEFDESDPGFFEHNMIDRGELVSILGQGGLGKSRLVMQLAACCITGLPFCGRPTRARGLKWMFIQTENGNKRLKHEMATIRQWLTSEQFQQFSEGLQIHTLEGEKDFNIGLVDKHGVTPAVFELSTMVETFDPQFVVWDALTDISTESLNHDETMNAAIKAFMTVGRAGGNNCRTPMIVHHAAAGAEGQKRGAGIDGVNFGRNSKRLFSRCRSQFNIVPESAGGDRLVVICGKNNNGPKFAPYLIELGEGEIYREVGGWSFEEWQAGIRQRSGPGRRAKQPPSPCEIRDHVPAEGAILKDDLWDEANPAGAGGERQYSRGGYDQRRRETRAHFA